MAKVGNVNVRKQGMCVGACAAGLRIIFRRQLCYMGHVVKESLFAELANCSKALNSAGVETS